MSVIFIILSFLKDLIKKISVLIVFMGIIFILFALIEIKGFGDFKIYETLNTTNWLLLGIGLLFAVIGVLLEIPELIDSRSESNGFKFTKITNDKYSMNINLGGTHLINIIYGKINDFREYDEKTLVVLPANDSFDDTCVEDPGSVLGAFVRSLYPNGNDIFKNKVKEELKNLNPVSSNIVNGVSTPIFRIGDGISISVRSEASQFNVGVVAVTHMMGVKITAYSENIMLAFKGIHEIMAKKRLSKVYIPLICSGHGGITQELSLLCLMISAIEQIRKNAGGILKEVNIVIYKKENGDIGIPIKRMIKVAKFVLNYCK
jgi:hypothetical protein